MKCGSFCPDWCANKCSRCWQKFPKYTLIMLNFLTFGTAAPLFVAGLFLLLESGFLQCDVIFLFDEITINSINLGILCLFLGYGMTAGGGAAMLAAVFGGIGAKRKSRLCLWMYVVVNVITLLFLFSVVGMWINLITKQGEYLEGQMLKQLKGYEGPEHTDVISEGWNQMFMQARCCGVNSISDFEDQNTVWANSKNPSESVPSTCCKGAEENQLYSCSGTPDYYNQGCYHKLIDVINMYSMLTFICVGILFFLKVVCSIFVCLIMGKRVNRVGSPRGQELHGNLKTNFKQYSRNGPTKPFF